MIPVVAFKTSFFHVLVHAGLHAIGQQHVARDFIAAEHESVPHCVCVWERERDTTIAADCAKRLNLWNEYNGYPFSMPRQRHTMCTSLYLWHFPPPVCPLASRCWIVVTYVWLEETGACDVPSSRLGIERIQNSKIDCLFYRYSRNLKHLCRENSWRDWFGPIPRTDAITILTVLSWSIKMLARTNVSKYRKIQKERWLEEIPISIP